MNNIGDGDGDDHKKKKEEKNDDHKCAGGVPPRILGFASVLSLVAGAQVVYRKGYPVMVTMMVMVITTNLTMIDANDGPGQRGGGMM